VPTDRKTTPDWPARLGAAWSSFHVWLLQPRVRLSVIGVTLLLIGGLLTTNSVWTLPLVVIGALMVAIAWMGHRLEGRFAVEWGRTGTELAFRATVKAAAPLPELVAGVSAGADETARAPAPGAAAPDDARPADVIEGVAHTVEIDVAELKALIAAVETAEARPTPPDAQQPDIRVRRVTPVQERASETVPSDGDRPSAAQA
jgi:hypothetical protein